MTVSMKYNMFLDVTESLLRSGEDLKLFVGGNSMYPHLKRGDYVKIKKRPFEDLKKGDIVVFESLQKYVAHRVIKIIITDDGRFLLTKGDSLKKPDSLVDASRYLGKITSYERHNRTVNLETIFFKRYNLFLACISIYTPFIYSTIRFLKHLFGKKK